MYRKRTCHLSASSKDFTARPFREMCVQRSCVGTLRACQSSRVIPAIVCTPTLLTSYLSTPHARSREPRKYRADNRIRSKNSTWSLPDTVWGRKLYSSLLIGTDWRPNLTSQSFKPSSLRRAILAPDAKAEFITLKATALCLLFAHVVCYKALKVTRLQEPADGELEEAQVSPHHWNVAVGFASLTTSAATSTSPLWIRSKQFLISGCLMS